MDISSPKPTQQSDGNRFRIIKVIIALLFLIGVVTLYYFYFSNKSITPLPGGTTGTLPVPGETTSGITSGITTGSSIGTTGTGITPFKPPTGNSISVKKRTGGELEIDNFYKHAEDITLYGDALIRETPNYIIWYFPRDSSFLIALKSTDVHLARALAESEFTAALNISQAQACELQVLLGIPRGVNQDLAGQDYGLSFCSWGKEF